MKKTILLLLLGSVTFVYGQNIDSTQNARKYLFHFKSDTIKISDSLGITKREKLSLEERKDFKNAVKGYSGYFNINAKMIPIGDRFLYSGQYFPLFNMGVVFPSTIYVGIDLSYASKWIYSNAEISPFSNSVNYVGLGVEAGKYISPQKTISLAPFIKASYNYMDVNKGSFSEFQPGFFNTYDKDWFLKLSIGTDVFINLTNKVRLGLGAGYTKALGVNMNYFNNKDLSGMEFTAKLQFHNMFQSIFKSYKKK